MNPTPDEWDEVRRDASSVHSSSDHASISAVLLQEVVDALRAGLPNEACGILVSDRYWTDGGSALRWIGLHNAAESPYRYMIDPQEQLQVWTQLDDAEEVVWGIVHSHVASEAKPSQTDVGLAFYPDSLYVVCSLTDFDHPTLRAWSIIDGAVSEVSLVVTE